MTSNQRGCAMRYGAASWVLAAVILAGCGGGNNPGANNPGGNNPGGAAANAPRDPAKFHQGAPITDDECRAFGETFAAAINSGDEAAGEALFDADAMLDQVTTGLGLNSRQLADFKRGFLDGFHKQGSFVVQLTRAVADGGELKPLGARTRDGDKRALLRLLRGDGGLNYHEFSLARRADDTVKAIDVYVYLTGEFLSQTIRRMVLPLVAREQRGLIERLTSKENDYIKELNNFTAMNNAIVAQQYDQALRIYQKLPESLRREKFVLVMRAQAAQGVGEQEYLDALEDLSQHFPNDPATDFSLMDSHFLRKKYDAALGCIDRLEKAVVRDPYLHTLRANMYTESRKFPEARQAAERAISEEPSLVAGYYSLLAANIAAKDHPATLQSLKKYAERFDPAGIDSENNPLFADFAKTPQHQEWLKIRREKPTAGPKAE